MCRVLRALAVALFAVNGAQAGPIGIAQIGGYVHVSGILRAQLDPSSSSFSTTLDSENLGTFGWSFTNGGSTPLMNVLFLVFLDADIDRDANTFFNEYGTFLSLSLPPTAPFGAIAASSWEIDEPGLVFGDIVAHLIGGALDNSNGVPSSAPDDASLALGFFVSQLDPNKMITVTMTIATADIGGLTQLDPDSGYQFFSNGFAAVSDAPTGDVPEPASIILVAGGLLVGSLRLLRKR